MVLDKGRHWFHVVQEQPLFYSVAHSLSTEGPRIKHTQREGGRGRGGKEGGRGGGEGGRGGREERRERGGKEGGR